MNLQTLIRQVNRDIDDSFSNADITDWLNRCLDDLTPIVKKESLQTYLIDSTNQYTIPTDFYQLVDAVQVDGDNCEVLNGLSQRDFSSKGYKIWSGTLSLQKGLESGTIDLYYYRKLNKLVNPTDIPEIEEPFHDLLVLYAIAMSQYMDEEPERQMDAFNRYLARKSEYEAYKNNQGFQVYQIGGEW